MWLLNEETFRAMQRAEASGLAPTAQQRTEFQAQIEARGGVPRNMSVSGSTAEIRVEGVLTKTPDLFAMLFGGGNTTYTDIQAALALADSDPAIKDVSLFIDSPGGNVHGLFDTLAALEAFSKPIKVRAVQAQSAAYAIAAAAGKIDAVNPAAMFGSIGTAVSLFVDDEVVTLTNTDSPDKRPDPRTEEGRAVIVQFLDAINELFVDAIARGRGVSASVVSSEFGRGRTVLAAEAKRKGMIDSISKPARKASVRAEAQETPELQVEDNIPPATSGAQQEKKHMTLEELKAQHPELCKELVAEGVKKGEAGERDRVCAHLTLGEASGDLKTAFEAIKSGEAMTSTLQAKYMAAGMNRRDREERQSESNSAEKVLSNADATEPDAKDLGDEVVALMEQRRGKKVS